MLGIRLRPMFSLAAHISREPAAPLRIWLRTTGYKLRPPRPVPHLACVRVRQDALLDDGRVTTRQRADIFVEKRLGPLPTIVIGGFVPDAADAFYLLRAHLMPHGSVYYFNYPPCGFSTDLFLAQLEDLIAEVTEKGGHRPVLVAVSFGAGLALELLRRTSAARQEPPLAGVVLVSPVACAADLLDPAELKPSTLLGRVIRPYLDNNAQADNSLVTKARSIFLKMFESGTQNKSALRFLLSHEETLRLRKSVLDGINAIDGTGAGERVRALCTMPPLVGPRPLFRCPTLILYTEKENSVLVENSPTRRELHEHLAAWFPRGRFVTVTNTPDNPVQHASLIFHCQNFQPHFVAFYRALRNAIRQAALIR